MAQSVRTNKPKVAQIYSGIKPGLLDFVIRRYFFKVIKPEEQQKKWGGQLISGISNNDLTLYFSPSESCTAHTLSIYGGDIKEMTIQCSESYCHSAAGKAAILCETLAFSFLGLSLSPGCFQVDFASLEFAES